MELFKPAWMSKRSEKAVRAVKRISDNKLLARIAVSALCIEARLTAVNRITSEEEFRSIFTSNCPNVNDMEQVLRTALYRLTNQQIIGYVASHCISHAIRLEAVKYLIDQQELYNLVNHSASPESIRAVAKVKITEPHLLSKLAEKERQDNRRRQEAFLKQALNTKGNDDVIIQALEQIEDDDLLLQYLKTNTNLSNIVFEKLQNNKDLLFEIARGCYAPGISEQAAQMVNDWDQLLLLFDSYNNKKAEAIIPQLEKLWNKEKLSHLKQAVANQCSSEQLLKYLGLINKLGCDNWESIFIDKLDSIKEAIENISSIEQMKEYMDILQKLDEDDWGTYFSEKAVRILIEQPGDKWSNSNRYTIPTCFKILASVYKNERHKDIIESIDGEIFKLSLEYKYGPDDYVNENYSERFNLEKEIGML